MKSLVLIMLVSTLATLALLRGADANVVHAPCVCTRQMEPTCGTDGVTYSNPCTLQCAARTGRSSRGTDLKVMKAGPCDPSQDLTL